PSPPGAAKLRPRWSQCAMYSTYSSERSLPSMTPTTLLDVVSRIWLRMLVAAVAPASGTALQPFCFALAVSPARSWSALASRVCAASLVIQPSTISLGESSSLEGRSYCGPDQLLRTTSQP